LEQGAEGRDEVVATLRRAASWLHRARFVPVTAHPPGPVAAHDDAAPECEAHGVAHTGKLARSIVVDLALCDAISRHGADGDAEALWQRAGARAKWVISRRGRDPDHGAAIFLPGRLDPRNASTSLIDAGECVDALATFARHPRFRERPMSERQAVLQAIQACADTYLAETVTAKAMVNQVLWGAMGLAHACAVFPDERRWREAACLAVAISVDRQRPDGSWGYETASPLAHPGVADLTVYYHGRCLAFLDHALTHVPEADSSGRAREAVRRGIGFLMAVRANDGTKSLALEGKRWFWASAQEAGSLAYDIAVLARAGASTGDVSLLDAARRSWHTLRARIDAAGAVRAGDGMWPLGDAADVVCRDFHVADLAWVARSLPVLWPHPQHSVTPDVPVKLIDERATGSRDGGEPRRYVRCFDQAGVVRLEVGGSFAIVRVAKAPCNAQWGGAIGGGTVVATQTGTSVWRDAAFTPGSVTVWPVACASGGLGLSPIRERVERLVASFNGARRFVATNPFGREGRQAAHVLRSLALAALRHLWHGHPLAATRLAVGCVARASRIEVRPFIEALGDVASVHWALACAGSGAVVTESTTMELSGIERGPMASWFGDVVPARRDGSVPEWARGVRVTRRVEVDATGVQVVDRIVVERLFPGPRGRCESVGVAVTLPVGASLARVRHGVGVTLNGWVATQDDALGLRTVPPPHLPTTVITPPSRASQAPQSTPHGSGESGLTAVSGEITGELDSAVPSKSNLPPRRRVDAPSLGAWRVWQGGATLRAVGRPRVVCEIPRTVVSGSSQVETRLHPVFRRGDSDPSQGGTGEVAVDNEWRAPRFTGAQEGTDDGTLEVAYRIDG
jgi:hypothetical protein